MFDHLTPKQKALLESERPRFSPAEIGRRRAALERVMAERGVAHLLIYGAQRFGGAVQWLTQWPITTEAAVIVTPGRQDTMFIQFHNHVPHAKVLAAETDVQWNTNTMAGVASELRKRGAANAKVGVMGPLTFSNAKTLEEHCGGLVDLGREWVRLRMIKSDEEIDWVRVGSALTDAGMQALKDALKPGVTEHRLGNAIQRAWVEHGASTVIHFIGLTSMANPDVYVPRQFTSNRKVKVGDVASAELTANFCDYGGQILRTFTVGAPPTPLYRQLHDTAQAAFDAITKVLRPGCTMAEILDASGLIEDAGFTTCDDLVHGFAGGYLPPVLGTKSRPAGPIPDLTMQKGMMVVVQPNVITKDLRAGVQTGELMLITESGCESMHRFPRGLHQVG